MFILLVKEGLVCYDGENIIQEESWCRFLQGIFGYR